MPFYYGGYVIRVRKQKPVGLYCLICDRNGAVIKRIPNLDSREMAEEMATWWIQNFREGGKDDGD